MTDASCPADESELAAVIKDSYDASEPLEVMGTGSKRSVGRVLQTSATVSTSRLVGITLYEPEELVLSAKAGTPLSLIEETLANHKQMLAFEPIDLGPALGSGEDTGTIGGVYATNLAGARRVMVGSTRDHLLGVRAVNGRGEIFKSGGRVMKNVTGYDLCKGLSGSWGTLAVMSEVTMKVLPQPEEIATLVVRGVVDEIAIDALCAAMGSPYSVTAASHFQFPMAQGFTDPFVSSSETSLTAIRIESLSEGINYKIDKLKDLLGHFGVLEVWDHQRSTLFWSDCKKLKFLNGGDEPVWRISTSPRNGVKVFKSVRIHHPDVKAVFDWSGGLIWLVMPRSSDCGSFEIHRAVAEYGGHATLIRAAASLRSADNVFQPLEPGVQRLTERIKSAFDPHRILNPGRMYVGI